MSYYPYPFYVMANTNPTDSDVENLLVLKKKLAQRRESLLQRLKQMGAQHGRDPKMREVLKSLKDHAGNLLRLHRACQLWAGHLMNQPPGDSPYRELRNWPAELLPECARVDSFLDQKEIRDSMLAEEDSGWHW